MSESATTRPNMERVRAHACYERGRQLAAANDYDYAHAMLAESVDLAPGELAYVEAMLDNLRSKFSGRKKRTGGKLSRPLKAAMNNREWPKVLRLGIGALANNPWQVATLHAMARACEELHYNDVELAYLKEALDANPADKTVNRHCAHSLARMGQLDQAIACWHRVEQISSGDQEAAEMIVRLVDAKLRSSSSGSAKQDSMQHKSRTENSRRYGVDRRTSASVQASLKPRLTPEQTLEQAIRDEPADASNYLRLADIYGDRGHFERAEQVLRKGARKCAQQSALQDALIRIDGLRGRAAAERAEIPRPGKSSAETRSWFQPRLELFLMISLVVLVLQLAPNWWSEILSAISNNARFLLVVLNLVVLSLLIWRRQRGAL